MKNLISYFAMIVAIGSIDQCQSIHLKNGFMPPGLDEGLFEEIGKDKTSFVATKHDMTAVE